MLSGPNAVVSHHDAVELNEPSRTPAGNAPVLITEQQVMFATAAGAASRTAAIRRPWIALFRQRVSLRSGRQRQPRRHYPPLRTSYMERAAMAREMDRL